MLAAHFDVGAKVHLDDIVILEDRGVTGVGCVVGGHVVPAEGQGGLAAGTPSAPTDASRLGEGCNPMFGRIYEVI